MTKAPRAQDPSGTTQPPPLSLPQYHIARRVGKRREERVE